MSKYLAALLGGAAAVLALVLMVLGFLWFYLLHSKNLSKNQSSETASSDPPVTAVWNRNDQSSSIGCVLPTEHQGARQFKLEEMEQATKIFNEGNVIGYGSFGIVYKGLLSDGTIVAIKRRVGAPRNEFMEEVHSLSEIMHRNLVRLVGYCQEGGLQMLVYEYLPNESIISHLFDTRQDSTTRLEFKQRLSVALGAAKGLSHLHSLVPPVVHKNFKTANVLVDENFIAKVADAGLYKLLQRTEEANSSQASTTTVFEDPRLGELGMLSETSDVYSFGVFLLELIMGREAKDIRFTRETQCLVEWVEANMGSVDLIDGRLGSSFTSEGMGELLQLTSRCLDLISNRRPKMGEVVVELDWILEKEMTLTTVMGDGTAIVTLGSQLFSSM